MKTLPIDGKFQLITLPYPPQTLAPAISAETLDFHHGKHLQTYINNLNAALPGSGLEGLPLEEVVLGATGGVRNNAGQILNHNLYFSQFHAPQPENRPTETLLAALERDFGSFEAFRAAFEKTAVTLFGSGWAWLSANTDGKLIITQEPNAQNPIQQGLRPLLTFDVWEHAYYIDYRNRRADHIAALWQIVDWDVIAQRYDEK